MLMAVRDEETQTGMTDQQLRDEVMTLVLAGHETTANVLSWAFYLLSKHPEVARRLQREVSSVLGGRSPTLADLGQLSYTKKVIEEALRLYPPAWVFEREAIADDEIGGYRIPKGGIVGISPWSIHRSTKLWDNPEGFDPERFSPEAVAARPKPRTACSKKYSPSSLAAPTVTQSNRLVEACSKWICPLRPVNRSCKLPRSPCRTRTIPAGWREVALQWASTATIGTDDPKTGKLATIPNPMALRPILDTLIALSRTKK
jgi:hypothetical protein